MLHNFDQSLCCAWPSPRAPIDKALHKIKNEIEDLVRTYYMIRKGDTNDETIAQLLQPLNKRKLEYENQTGLNPLKPRLWKKMRAILGAERYHCYFPICQSMMNDYLKSTYNAPRY